MKDTYCSFCGTAYAAPTKYPRTCANDACAKTIWANPIPVAVVLVPVVHEVSEGQRREGLLVVRRGIEPGKGKLALAGGFLEEHESWQTGGAREVREETNIEIDASTLESFWYVSTEPKPNRVLLFSIAQPVTQVAPFTPNSETQERGLVYGPDGLDEVMAFSLHAQAIRRYFQSRGQSGPHGFTTI